MQVVKGLRARIVVSELGTPNTSCLIFLHFLNCGNLRRSQNLRIIFGIAEICGSKKRRPQTRAFSSKCEHVHNSSFIPLLFSVNGE